MTGVAVLAALALPMTAMAENKLVVQDGSSVDKFVVTDQGAVGAGTNAPTGQLDVVKQWPNSVGTNNISVFTSYGDASRLTVRSALGTQSAPTRTTVNKMLGNVNFRGFDGAAFSTSGVAAIQGYAEADFTSTSQPTRIAFFTTPSNAIVGSERLRISSDGRLRLSNQPAAPANNATCAVGDLILDAAGGYLYLCTATNTWKRTSFTSY